MPKSKRAKVVHTSKVTKKGKELTHRLFANVRSSIDTYAYVFVFRVSNMRNTYLKDVRNELEDSRLLFGKTKVMAKSLGSTEADEYAPNLSQLSTYLTGSVGLLFTNQTPEKIVEYFSSFSRTDFARAGVESPRTFILPAGILHSRGGEIDETDDVPLPHSIEPNLRALGVPTRLMKGKVELENDYEICKEGDVLDSRQTRLLKMFGVAVAEFSVELLAYWGAESNQVVEIGAMEE